MYALHIVGAFTLLFVIILLYRKRLINCQIFRDCFSVLIALQGMVSNLKDSVSSHYIKNPLPASWVVWDMHARIMQSFILFFSVTQPLLKVNGYYEVLFSLLSIITIILTARKPWKTETCKQNRSNLSFATWQTWLFTQLKRTVCLDDSKQWKTYFITNDFSRGCMLTKNVPIVNLWTQEYQKII